MATTTIQVHEVDSITRDDAGSTAQTRHAAARTSPTRAIETDELELHRNAAADSKGGVSVAAYAGHTGATTGSTALDTEEIELTVMGRKTGGNSGAATGEDAPRNDSTAEDIMEQSRAFDALAPDGGFDAWLQVGCCSMIAGWYVGVTYSWGVLQQSLVDSNLAPASTLAFVGSLAVAMLSVLALINSRLMPLIGARRMALAGTLLMSAGQILAGFSTHNIAGLFVTAGVCMGCGVSLSFMVVSIGPAQYFNKRKGTAVGIVYAAGGLGGAVISLGLEACIKRIGIAWTFRLIGLVLLACCLPCAWLIKERAPTARRGFVDWSLFRSWDFVLLFLAGAFATFPLFVPPFFLPLYAQSLHMSTSMGATLVCIFNFSSAVGRILTGIISDRLLGPLNTLCLSLLLTAVTLLVLWPTSTGFPELVVFVLFNGASNGGFFSIMPTVVSMLLGSQRLGVAFGMIVTAWAGGYLMGAPIAGYMLAAYGGTERGAAAFKPAIYWAAAMSAAAAGLVIFLRLQKSTKLKVKM